MGTPSTTLPETNRNSPQFKKRPPYITVASLALWASALLAGVLAIMSLLSRPDIHLNLQVEDIEGILLAGAIVVSFTLAGIGLWRMKKWGIALFWLGFALIEIPTYIVILQNQKALNICLAVFQIAIFVVISVTLWRAIDQQPADTIQQ